MPLIPEPAESRYHAIARIAAGVALAVVAWAALAACSDSGSGAEATATPAKQLTRFEQCQREAGKRAGASCPRAAKTLAEASRDDINEFWDQAFRGGGRPYEAPADFVAYDKPIDTGCGESEPDNAFYCGKDHAIYYDVRFLGREFASHGEYAPVFIIAHEWGHLVQANLDLLAGDSLYSIDVELQADCFAGVYMQDAQLRKLVVEKDLDSAVVALFHAGDEVGTPWNDPAAHGTAGERIDAFNAGFTEGIDACMD